MKYRKKPVIVDAFLWQGEPAEKITGPEWIIEAMKKPTIDLWSIWMSHDFGKTEMQIRALSGIMIVIPGGYIVRNADGSIYSIDSESFEATYELVEETNARP